MTNPVLKARAPQAEPHVRMQTATRIALYYEYNGTAKLGFIPHVIPSNPPGDTHLLRFGGAATPPGSTLPSLIAAIEWFTRHRVPLPPEAALTCRVLYQLHIDNYAVPGVPYQVPLREDYGIIPVTREFAEKYRFLLVWVWRDIHDHFRCSGSGYRWAGQDVAEIATSMLRQVTDAGGDFSKLQPVQCANTHDPFVHAPTPLE